MTDKEKIEEMVYIMRKECHTQSECPFEDCKECYANALIEDGYRKITENEVVISKEELRSKTMIDKDLFETRAKGYKVENGKLVYFSNMLDGYRHEFKDLQEICEEMNTASKEFDSLMSQLEFWQCEAETYKLWKDKLVEQIINAREETGEILKALYSLTQRNPCGIALITKESVEELAKKYSVDLGE